MKFLTINKMKDVFYTLPATAMLSIIEPSLVAINDLTKEGKIVEKYYSPGTGELISILNYDNAEQLQKDSTRIPLMRYYNYTTYVLSNHDEFAKSYLESLKSAIKAMPGASK